MKRILLPMLLCFLLLLCACGKETAEQPAPLAEDGALEEELPEELDEGEDEAEIELPIVVLKEEPADPAHPSLSKRTVTLEGISNYLRVTLPRGWSWREGDESDYRHVLELYPDERPGFVVEMAFWDDSFALRDDGQTLEDYPLPGGLTATLATKETSTGISWTLILPESPDRFTFQIGADKTTFADRKAELELMLSSLQLGVLAKPNASAVPSPTA